MATMDAASRCLLTTSERRPSLTSLSSFPRTSSGELCHLHLVMSCVTHIAVSHTSSSELYHPHLVMCCVTHIAVSHTSSSELCHPHHCQPHL